MTYKQLQDEVILLRFNEAKRASVKSWLNLCYERIWNHADWVFKRVPATALTVTSGAATEPGDLARVTRLYDPRGDALLYLRPDEFEANYIAPVPVPTGNAEAYTVINRDILVGPGETGSFKVAYQRRLSHVDATLGITGGVMVEDTDQPLWPAEHDYALIWETVLMGARVEGDPNVASYQQNRDEALASMVADLAGSGVEGEPTFWGVAC